MADADPENEISDVERPKDRPLDPCHGEAVPHLISPRAEADENHRPKKSHERIKPARRVAQRPQKIVVDFPFQFKIHILNVGPTGPSIVSTPLYLRLRPTGLALRAAASQNAIGPVPPRPFQYCFCK